MSVGKLPEALKGLSPDDQLFLLLQSMGYGPKIPLWKYQQSKDSTVGLTKGSICGPTDGSRP